MVFQSVKMREKRIVTVLKFILKEINDNTVQVPSAEPLVQYWGGVLNNKKNSSNSLLVNKLSITVRKN